MFQSERFFREAWPTISQLASPSDGARDVWSHLAFYGALDGTPFSLDAPRLVIVARK